MVWGLLLEMIKNPGKKYQYGDFIREIFIIIFYSQHYFVQGVDVMRVGVCVRARAYIYNQLIFICSTLSELQTFLDKCLKTINTDNKD